MILDVTVGGRKIYHGRDKLLGSELVGVDIRKGHFERNDPHCWSKQIVDVEPQVLADMKTLPFRDGVFDLIIFDPPHTDAGLGGWLGMWYGSWTQTQMIRTVRVANDEFARVLKPTGFLLLKIMPRQTPAYETLLKNFNFFLPIYTIRTRGSFNDTKKAEGAAWFLCRLKQIENGKVENGAGPVFEKICSNA
jgi:ubiquinone/menaquinone biosynthesis C-methylase UbiE